MPIGLDQFQAMADKGGPWGMVGRAGLAKAGGLTKPPVVGGPQLPPWTPPPGGVNLPQFPPTQPAPAPGGPEGGEPPWIQRARLQRKQGGGMQRNPQAPPAPRPQMPKAPTQGPAGPYGGIMGGQEMKRGRTGMGGPLQEFPAPGQKPQMSTPDIQDTFGKVPSGWGG